MLAYQRNNKHKQDTHVLFLTIETHLAGIKFAMTNPSWYLSTINTIVKNK